MPFAAALIAVPFPFKRPETEVEMVRTGFVAFVKEPAKPFVEATEKVDVAKVVSAPVPPFDPMSPYGKVVAPVPPFATPSVPLIVERVVEATHVGIPFATASTWPPVPIPNRVPAPLAPP